jgi:biotin carboxylase
VLKVDGTSGGYGVRIVSTLEEAKEAYETISVPVSVPCAVKRMVVDRNETYLMPALKQATPVVNLQRFVSGDEATCTAACWQGEVVGCVALRVIKNSGRVGWSTVVQVIDEPEVLQAIKKLCRRLRVTGLYGFDFILERESGRPFLLEINPRATPTTHLRTSAGSLAFALRLALTGTGTKPEPLYRTGERIALFPQEWHRDPESDFLKTARNDTPWNEPEFVRACLRRETAGWRALFQPGGKLARVFSKVAG